MAKSGWLIYGANGYTGTLVVEEAIRRGHRPILAGRSAEKLAPLGARFGLEVRAFPLADAAAIERALADVALVFHAAGPFVDTSAPMVAACLATRTHYLDITGEVPVFERLYRHDAAARSAGVALISGVGFDVVPTDCLALYLARKLPGATELELAIAGLDAVSPGTAKSMLDGALAGGLARRAGALVPMPFGKQGRRVRFADRERAVLPIPWGDLASAYRSTQIPDITTYMAFPSRLAKGASASWRLTSASLPLVRSLVSTLKLRDKLGSVIEQRVQGPSEQARERATAQVWGAVRDRDGRSVEAWLETRDGYTFTALSGVHTVERVLRDQPVGALTPALAFGPDYVLEIPGSRRHDVLGASSDRSAGDSGREARA